MKKWTDDELIKATRDSKSICSILRKLGLKINGNSHKKIKDRIKKLDLDTSHFTGKGWCKGENHEKFIRKHVEHPLEDILVKNSTYLCGAGLKKKLIKAKMFEDKCCDCGLQPTWQGKPITLQLHHVNGNRKDNRIKNLKILCPNCHSQTPTYMAKNIKNRRPKILTKILSVKIDSATYKEYLEMCIKSNKTVSDGIREYIEEKMRNS